MKRNLRENPRKTDKGTIYYQQQHGTTHDRTETSSTTSDLHEINVEETNTTTQKTTNTTSHVLLQDNDDINRPSTSTSHPVQPPQETSSLTHPPTIPEEDIDIIPNLLQVTTNETINTNVEGHTRKHNTTPNIDSQTLLDLLKNINEKVNQQSIETKNINEKIEIQTKNINEKIELQTNKIDQQSLDTKNINEKIDQQALETKIINEGIEMMYKELQSQNESMNNRVTILENNQTEIEQKLLQITTEQINQQQNIITLEQRIEGYHDELENNLEEKCRDVITASIPNLELKTQALEGYETKIDSLTRQANKQEETIKQLKKSMENKTNNNNSQTPNIYVNCNGGNSQTIDNHLPKFNGRSINPPDYISKLNRYIDIYMTRQPTTIDPTTQMKYIIESSLEGHAARWFSIIKEEIENWNDFETKFRARYWNTEVQRGIKSRIENDKYFEKGKLSRTEYFEERVLLLKSLTPPLSDNEILNIIVNHFSDIIQSAYRVQNIQTIATFQELLQREDIHDPSRRGIRQTPNQDPPNNYRPPYHNNYTPTKYEHRNRYSTPRPPPTRPFHNQEQPQHQRYTQYTRNEYHPTYGRYESRPPNRKPNNPYRPRSNTPPHNLGQRTTNPPYREDRKHPTEEQRQICSLIAQSHSPPKNNSSEDPTPGVSSLNA